MADAPEIASDAPSAGSACSRTAIAMRRVCTSSSHQGAELFSAAAGVAFTRWFVMPRGRPQRVRRGTCRDRECMGGGNVNIAFAAPVADPWMYGGWGWGG
jgi:hypothetical protein